MIWSEFFLYADLGTDSSSVLSGVFAFLFAVYRAGAPVKTGRFKAGLSYDVAYGSGGAEMTVFSDVDYGEFVEEFYPVGDVINVAAVSSLVGG